MKTDRRAARHPARRRRSPLAAGLLALIAAAPLGAKEVPYLTGRVNDYADLLTDAEEQALADKLERHEGETGSQVVVLTIDSLEGEVLEDYSLKVAETWQLGREGVDDGVLLLVSRDDRKLRLEVGYGLEPVLTDLEAGHIIDRAIVPRFREGDFAGGIDGGIDAVLGTLRGDEGAIPPPAESPLFEDVEGPWYAKLLFLGVFILVIGTFSLSATFAKGCQGWFLYFFLMPFYLMFPGAALGFRFGILTLAAWVIGFPLLRLLLGKTPAGRRFVLAHPGLSTWASSGRGSSGGGFSGGFSGGGGSFGGGGASGSW